MPGAVVFTVVSIGSLMVAMVANAAGLLVI